MNLFTFFEQFGSVEQCISFFDEQRICCEACECDRCHSMMRRTVHKGTLVNRCPRRGCQAIKSFFHGTILDNARIPYPKVLLVVLLWLNQVPTMKIVGLSGLDHKTVQFYIGRAEEVISASLDEEDTIIGGPGIEVQIDESKFGRRKANRGHHVGGVWVLGGVEVTIERRVFLMVVPDRSASTLGPIICRHVARGSTIVTDGWRGYVDIEALGYRHLSVNHRQHFVDPDTGAHTNVIEGTWNGLKQNISARQRTTELIGGKLTEFIWRRKHKDGLWGGFVDAMRIAHLE
jgi:hypothetical protein